MNHTEFIAPGPLVQAALWILRTFSARTPTASAKSPLSLLVRNSAPMVDDKSPKLLTRAEAMALVTKAAQLAGVLDGPATFGRERGFGISDPESRQMRVHVKVKGTDAAEILEHLTTLGDAIDNTAGVQVVHAEGVGPDSPERVLVVCYYANNTGQP